MSNGLDFKLTPLRLNLASIAVLFCASVFLVDAGGLVSAQNDDAPKPFQRKIFVPFESLDVLLDGNSNRVLLSKKEYQDLLESARTREIRRAPVDSAIVSATYSGEISEGVATIEGELLVEALNDGLVQIPLPFNGVAIRSARLGDTPAKLWRDESGQIVLLTSSGKRETLLVELTVPLQTSAARQSMSVQLPSPSATQFRLRVPGNVDVKSGVPVFNRIYDETENITSFDLLTSRELMNIVMSLNNRLLKDDQVVVSRSVMIHKLTPHLQEMHVTCSVDVIHGAMEQIEFLVPEGFQVSQVSTPMLNQWEIKDSIPESDESGTRLVVKLRQPTREDFVLSITATRNLGATGEWVAQEIRPLAVAGHVAVVGILADIALSSSKLVSEGVIPIDHEFLLAAIPSSLQATTQGNPVTVVAAYYAPQREYSIAARFAVPEPRLIVKSNSRLVIGNQRLELQGGISLVSRHDSRFGFRMSLPDSWRLNELKDIQGNPVRFDRVGVDGRSEFLVYLPERIASKGTTKVFFKASSSPAGWLEKWQTNQIQFPVLRIENESKHTGAIAVSTSEDLSIKPAEAVKLELLAEEDKKTFELDRKNAPLAYQFNDTEYRLDLILERLKPAIMARTYNYFTIKPNQLLVHAELIYDVKQAKAGEFRFELPLNTPKSISISSTQDQLKDYSSEETESARRWTVQLTEPRKGQIQLLVDFAVPMEESGLANLQLVPAVVNDVSFQASMLAVEGSPELDIEIQTEGRAVDAGEFSEALYQPGRYMLGAYSWPDSDVSLSVQCARRPVYQLPAAIVQRAEMVTSISTHGKSQTAARFQLVTKQQPFLQIELPKGATLWSVQLDGEPAKPQRQNDSLLISLIGNEAGKLRDLQLVFESPASSFQFVGNVAAQAPVLWLNESAEEKGMQVPLVDLHWRLVMPDGFRVSHGDGAFQSEQLRKRPTPIQQLGNWLYRLGGGIGEMSLAPQIREAAMNGYSQAPTSRAPEDSMSISGIGTQSESEEGFKDKYGPPPPLPPIPAQDARRGELAPGQIPAPQAVLPTPSNPQMGSGAGLARKESEAKMASLWALSGLRSLDIELTDTGNAIDFYNLGEQPELVATVVNQARVNWVAIAIAFFIAAIGVLLTRRKLKSKLSFVILVLLVACLVPLAGAGFEAFRTVVDLAILAAVFVAAYFVLAGLIRLLSRSLTTVLTRVLTALVVVIAVTGFSGTVNAQQVVSDVEQLKKLIDVLQTEPNVELPADAIIVPFDPADPQGQAKADRLLVPYEHYLQLINRAKTASDPDEIKSPVGYVLSSAEYRLDLTLEEDVTIKGKLTIELLSEDPVTVSLPMLGGALADASVDGKPAKLQFASTGPPSPSPQQQQQQQQQQSRPQSPPTENVVQLYLEGSGTKTFEFSIQLKPARQGGWRILNARLPIGMTRGLDLNSLNEPTEIRLNSDADRRAIEARPNQSIATVLSADGSLRLQWKPSTATQAIDQSLTANSEAIFDVREDGLRLTWRVDMDFRGSERDVFTLNLPTGFLVEQVSGENVRAWDVKSETGKNQLNITTLSAAKDQESFLVELSQRDFSIGESKLEFDAPYLTVEGAALHQGIYVIRRSPIIEVKTRDQRGVNRVDSNQVNRQIDLKSLDANSSPLGIEPYQALQFVTTPFRIGLEAQRTPRTVQVNSQSILRIGQTEANLEMRINVDMGQRPIYKFGFDLPQDVEVRQLSAGQNETWTSEVVDQIQRIELFFPRGISSEFSILVDAALTAYSGGDQWSIPQITMKDVEQQDGQIAVQVDPALSVTTENLQNCEVILLKQVESWLNASQRSTTRLAMRTKGAEYGATLKFTRIQPRVSVETVTNVRTTLFAIEETVLLDFSIQQAGIRQVQFELPVELRNARIIAKLVSETVIEDLPNNPNAVRVTLNLQDDVIDSYRVVIENDRQLSAGRQTVPVPRVVTGITEQRFVTLQNAGRDEIAVRESQDFQRLNRQLQQFAKLKQKLSGGEVTMAYVAQSAVDWPVLEFETNQREVFETVAASIEFSKTIMVVDASGAYRALQNFQVNNRSEQYLEIELPAGAQLLTVLVEGQPVKPVAWPAAQNEQRLRIPLVKTPAGDLDYPVQLKYAGRLGNLSGFTEIEFPVIESLNINVQLSQLHLRLPDSHRWMNFGGTMTKVDDRGKLEESFLSYKRRQIEQLAEQIRDRSSKLGSFGKSRAYSNLKKLEDEMADFESANPELQMGANARQIQELYQQNNIAIQQAQQIYSLENSKSGEIQIDNRSNFNDLVEGQSYRIARNSVTKQGQNFRFESPPMPPVEQSGLAGENEKKESESFKSKQGMKQAFDSQWLSRNKLNLPADKPSSGKRAAGRDELTLKEAIVVADIADNVSEVDNSITFVNPADSIRLAQESSDSEQREVDTLGDPSGVTVDSRLNGQFGFQADAPSRDGKPSDANRGMGLGLAANQPLPNSGGQRGFQGGLGGGGGGFGGGLGGDSGAQDDDPRISESSLASLDIELPERGVDFYFKSPRGKASVIVRPIEARAFASWGSALVTVGVAVGVWVGCWLLLLCWRGKTFRILATLMLLLAGVISMVSGFLPIYGFIALVASVVMIIDWGAKTLIQTRPQPT